MVLQAKSVGVVGEDCHIHFRIVSIMVVKPLVVAAEAVDKDLVMEVSDIGLPHLNGPELLIFDWALDDCVSPEHDLNNLVGWGGEGDHIHLRSILECLGVHDFNTDFGGVESLDFIHSSGCSANSKWSQIVTAGARVWQVASLIEEHSWSIVSSEEGGVRGGYGVADELKVNVAACPEDHGVVGLGIIIGGP